MKSTILVTGGAGYIGSHCCKALADAGYQPVCFDNLTTGNRDSVQWGPLVIGDVTNPADLAQVFANHDIRAVLHFAALSVVGESTSNPEAYYRVNVGGTLALLAAMRAAGCDKIVFSSTGAVYGDAGDGPIVESAAGNPINPYGKTKWAVEGILDDYRAAYGIGAICLRYFNASGADPSGLIGEKRPLETHLIPRAMMTLQGHASDFAVFGDDYATPDGTAIRDYVHVNDLAAAHIRSLELLLRGERGGSYNLGTGQGYSVRQILDAIALEAGRPVPATLKPRRGGDPPVLVADPSAAHRALDFTPAHSDLASIVRTSWAWHRTAHPQR
jgi:UDP-arabinose 4-epimerase